MPDDDVIGEAIHHIRIIPPSSPYVLGGGGICGNGFDFGAKEIAGGGFDRQVEPIGHLPKVIQNIARGGSARDEISNLTVWGRLQRQTAAAAGIGSIP